MMRACLQEGGHDAQPKDDAPPGHAAPKQRHRERLVGIVGQAHDVCHQDAHADEHLHKQARAWAAERSCGDNNGTEKLGIRTPICAKFWSARARP